MLSLWQLGTVGIFLAMGGGLWYGRARSRTSEFTAAVSGAAAAEKNKSELKEEGESLLQVALGPRPWLWPCHGLMVACVVCPIASGWRGGGDATRQSTGRR